MVPYYSFASELNEEQEKINLLKTNIDHNIRIINDFLDNIPQSSALINLSIISGIILFYIGVIYPLSFLPIDNTREINLSINNYYNNSSMKGIILLAISVVFTFIMSAFLIINSKLRFYNNSINKLKSFTKLSTYSIYFVNMEENLKAKSEQPPVIHKLSSKKKAEHND